jgi:hypothetical protein
MVEWLKMNRKGLGGKWLWSCSRKYPDIFLEGLRKTTKTLNMTASVPAKIRTERLQNTALERYRYADPLGISLSLIPGFDACK